MLENLDLVLLVMDETVDGGYVIPSLLQTHVRCQKSAVQMNVLHMAGLAKDIVGCSAGTGCRLWCLITFVPCRHAYLVDGRATMCRMGWVVKADTELLVQSHPGDRRCHNSRQSGHEGTR